MLAIIFTMFAYVLIASIISVIIIYKTTNKEIGNHIITLCYSCILQMNIIESLSVLLSVLFIYLIKICFVRKKQIDIPLYYISCIRILLIDRLRRKRMIFLVVFTVTNIIHFPVSLLVIRCKSQVCIKMVHALTVTLVCKPPWYFIMWSANQIIYHSLKYNIEAFCKYVFLSMRIDGDTIRVLEECIAQIPKLQSLV